VRSSGTVLCAEPASIDQDRKARPWQAPVPMHPISIHRISIHRISIHRISIHRMS